MLKTSIENISFNLCNVWFLGWCDGYSSKVGTIARRTRLFEHSENQAFNMPTFRTLALIALVCASAIAMTTSASARVVCRHTQSDYVYPPTLGLTVHDNDWKWKEGEKHMWREHEGKGYWKGGS
jgi:hypothetical protein